MASWWTFFMIFLALPWSVQTESDSSYTNGLRFFRNIYNNLTTPDSDDASHKKPSDIIFIIDLPGRGTVYATGFQILLGFIQSFLENVTESNDATRVALVISDKLSCTVPIDGISSNELTKCFLVHKLRKMKLKVPGSVQGDKCQDPVSGAITVAKSGRPDVPKVVIVMAYDTTHGLQRVADHTMAALHSLTFPEWSTPERSRQIRVYGVGIGKAKMAQIKRAATPGDNSWIYLQTFRTLMDIARSLESTRVFRPTMQRGTFDSHWQSVTTRPDSACSVICDEHAKCSCSLTTGQTLCTCLPGYYGNGHICTPCPRGTYKEETSARRGCTPCPVHMGTQEKAANSIDLCQPGLPIEAEENIRSCLELPAIAYAVTFGVSALISAGVRNTGLPCSYKSGTSCHFECRSGFRMIGSPGLMCQWDGIWSGQVPRCVETADSDCGTLEEIGQQDLNGDTTYINNIPISDQFGMNNRNIDLSAHGGRHDLQDLRSHIFGQNSIASDSDKSRTRLGAVLQVDCPTTWRLWGDAYRTCSKHGVWSSTPARCIDPRCPPVPLTEGLVVYPPGCLEEWQVPGTTCQLTCSTGYRLLGTSNITCGENRRWRADPVTDTSQVLGVCLDEEPPAITCRSKITLYRSGVDHAMLRWEDVSPTVTDNSGHVTVTSSDIPGNPFPVYFGNHTISFDASDTNHTVSCSITVELKDRDVLALECPTEEVTVYTQSFLDHLILPPVRFVISSKGGPQPLGHFCKPRNHSLERTGRHDVVCWAYAPYGYLGAECRFSVFMEHVCQVPPPPRHGYRHCNASQCTVSCEPGYQFYEPVEERYVCGQNGRWLQWPDCSRSYNRRGAMLDGTYSLSLEFFNASDCLAKKLQVQAQALTVVQAMLDTKCSSPDECALVKLNVTCFGSDGEDIGDRDDVYDVYWPVLNFTVKANSTLYDMEHNVHLLESISVDLAPVLANITHDGRHSSHSDTIYGVHCMLGYQALADVLCVACPAGTYWNQRVERCLYCPTGQYQPLEAQSSCRFCPDQQYTVSMGAQNESQCAASCSAGSWSPTGLAPCRLCERGQFQPVIRSSGCLNCPGDYMTHNVGTTERAQCHECDRGTAGFEGIEPFCEPCPLDSYQPLRGQQQCKPLPHMFEHGQQLCNQSTFMCYNGGQCIDPRDKDSVTECQCLPGFTGLICEQLDQSFCPEPYSCPTINHKGEWSFTFWQYQDPCQSSPCHNGGSCLNSNEDNSYQCCCPIGYSGPLCEDVATLCRGMPCVHGECDDGGECVCAVGYAGVSCNTSVDPCWFGLISKGCEPKNPSNPCHSQPCALGSTCLSKTDGTYVCKCPAGATGPHCSNQLTTNADMEFSLEPRLGWDVTLPPEFMPSLASMTLCMWLRPSPLTSYFTIVTLETSEEPEIDFANSNLSKVVLGLYQTEQLKIQFFNEIVATGMIIPSMVWTHLCFTWSRTTGSWQVFFNGTLARSGKFVERDQAVPERTFVTIAPRNNTLSDWSIFLGRISQFNIFSDVLPVSQIQGLSNLVTCNQSFYGDVISWTNALPYAFTTSSSLCLDVNECWYPSQFPCFPPTDVCIDTLGSFKCIDPQNMEYHRKMKILVGVGAAVCVTISIAVAVVLFRSKRRKNRNRDITHSQPGLQLRQGTSTHVQAGVARGDELRSGNPHEASGTDKSRRSPIVRSRGWQLGRRGLFKRRQHDYMKGKLVTADSLEETVIFDQSEASEGGDRPTQSGDLDGNTDNVQSLRQQDFVLNTNYRPGDQRLELDALEEEPASLTFRTPTSRGTSNPVEYLRSKIPSLNFGRQKKAHPVGSYTHLQEDAGASDQLDLDNRGDNTEPNVEAHSEEDLNTTLPQDGGQEP